MEEKKEEGIIREATPEDEEAMKEIKKSCIEETAKELNLPIEIVSQFHNFPGDF